VPAGAFLEPPPVRPDPQRDKGSAERSYQASYIDAGYSNPGDRPTEPDSGGLFAYGRILRRRKGTLFLIACLGAIAGFLVTLPQAPIYQARASLEIVGLNQNFLNIKEANPLNEGQSTIDSTDIQTQIKILQSESLVDRVLGKMAVSIP